MTKMQEQLPIGEGWKGQFLSYINMREGEFLAIAK
jgi:hypothetical protein